MNEEQQEPQLFGVPIRDVQQIVMTGALLGMAFQLVIGEDDEDNENA